MSSKKTYTIQEKKPRRYVLDKPKTDEEKKTTKYVLDKPHTDEDTKIDFEINEISIKCLMLAMKLESSNFKLYHRYFKILTEMSDKLTKAKKDHMKEAVS